MSQFVVELARKGRIQRVPVVIHPILPVATFPSEADENKFVLLFRFRETSGVFFCGQKNGNVGDDAAVIC